MNEQLMETADKALVELLDVFIKTKDFAIEQAPDVVQQLLMWNMVEAFVFLVLGLMLGLSLIKAIPFTCKQLREDNVPLDFFMLIYSAGAGILSIPLFMANFLTFLKIWFAPKVWLIEYAASLVK